MHSYRDSQPQVAIVAAIGAHDRALGKGNALLWRIPDDLKRLKALTTGHPIIMGRKTFESIGRPLPDRTNIVITRDQNYRAEGCVVAHSLEQALELARRIDNTEIFILGGAQIYAQALPYTDKLYLTLIDDKKKADAFFPPYETEFTKETTREERATEDGLRYTWVNLERS
jgi:dihydrofolate reductase